MRTAKYTIRIKDDTPSWLKPDAELRNRQWSAFNRTCESLAKDGFDYSVSIAPKAEYLTLTITGTCEPAQASKVAKQTRHHVSMPAKLTVERCQKRATESLKQLDSDYGFYHRTLKFETPAWRKFDGFLHAAVVDGGFDADETLRESLAAAWCDVADPKLGYHANILRSIMNQSLTYVLWELSYVADTPYRSIKCINPGDYFGSESLRNQNIESARIWYANRESSARRETVVERASKQAAREFLAQDFAELRAIETEFWRDVELMAGERDAFKPGLSADSIYEVAA
jgi:hypothetical protein